MKDIERENMNLMGKMVWWAQVDGGSALVEVQGEEDTSKVEQQQLA